VKEVDGAYSIHVYHVYRANVGILWVKGSPYSISERKVPELIPVLAVSLQAT